MFLVMSILNKAPRELVLIWEVVAVVDDDRALSYGLPDEEAFDVEADEGRCCS